jgi:hypothetical protein
MSEHANETDAARGQDIGNVAFDEEVAIAEQVAVTMKLTSTVMAMTSR